MNDCPTVALGLWLVRPGESKARHPFIPSHFFLGLLPTKYSFRLSRSSPWPWLLPFLFLRWAPLYVKHSSLAPVQFLALVVLLCWDPGMLSRASCSRPFLPHLRRSWGVWPSSALGCNKSPFEFFQVSFTPRSAHWLPCGLKDLSVSWESAGIQSPRSCLGRPLLLVLTSVHGQEPSYLPHFSVWLSFCPFPRIVPASFLVLV